MTHINDKNYFTIGELASLHGIPKQTLIYYANVGLLLPAFVLPNGYRCYATQQFLILEIILNLRKLDVSVKDIKAYLENRNPHALIELLKAQHDVGNRLISIIQNKQTNICHLIRNLEQQRTLTLNCFQTSHQEARPVFLSAAIRPSCDGSERLRLYAKHTQKIWQKHVFRSMATGFIIRKNDFFAQNFRLTHKYFTPALHETETTVSMPAGLYVSINFTGTYYENIALIYGSLTKYLTRNYLHPTGDIYILPLKDHWVTSAPKHYINQLMLPVKCTEKIFAT